MKQVTIPTADNHILVGTLFYPEAPKGKNPAVLFIPGWTSSEDSYHERAQALVALGYICLTVSLRGHGQSSGKREDFSRADHLKDILAAYDFLGIQRCVDPQQISVVGTSYGGYLAAMLASKRAILHLVLRAPAFYYNENFTTTTFKLLADREADFFQNLKVEANNFALEGIKHVNGKILVIESQKDQIIPNTIIGLYLAAAPMGRGSKKSINGADHQLSQGEWRSGFINFLSDFFKSVRDVS